MAWMKWSAGVLLSIFGLWLPVAQAAHYNVIIRGGSVHDGTGGTPFMADLAIQNQLIVAIGRLDDDTADHEVDARGLVVAPGFINMLSWATESLIEDGRSLADVRQGVTLEVFGEGWSMGPLNDAMRAELIKRQGDIRFDVPWTTLSEYLEYLVQRGVSVNVASFVGATTVRMHELGEADRPPEPAELERMQQLVRQAMEDGAMGLGSSLIYAPAFYADTEELIALARVAGEYDGMYISHMRSEGNRLLEAVDELITIADRGGLPAEIYHLKAAGKDNWGTLDKVLEQVRSARSRGLRVSADMYTYTAGATGLDAAMPPWVQEGGLDAWIARLKDPATRARVITEMRTETDQWENLMRAAGSADKLLLVGFKSDALKPLTGRTLAAVADERGVSPEDAAIDLVIEDQSRVGTVYFLMSEDNIARKIRQPWVSFGSDGESPAPEGVFLKSNPHPRAYGNFARLLGRYVRDEQVISLSEAIRRLTSLPASNLGLRGRGKLATGYHGDVVVFDADRIADHATFAEPHQLSTGVVHVFVNGEAVLTDGRHTGNTPGQVVRGPGWRGWSKEPVKGTGDEGR